MKLKQKIASEIIVTSFLAFAIAPCWAEEVTFLKTKFMNAQQRLGSAVLASAQVKSQVASGQEELGRLIRDAASPGKMGQDVLARGIASEARLKQQEGQAQEQLGSAILNASQIRSREEKIRGAVQEDLGIVILGMAQSDRIQPATSAALAIGRAGRVQEALGRDIQRRAQFSWAEGTLARQAQAALLSAPGSKSARLPQEVLSILRQASGRTHEENVRLATTLMPENLGEALGQILPSRPEPVGFSLPIGYAAAGWGGFGEFGLPALLGFLWAMSVFLWIIQGFERSSLAHSSMN